MTTFALVHGAWHGGWHWHAVVDALQDRGHRVVAPDLPIDRPEVGALGWADAISRSLSDDHEPIVVVGQGLGGLSLPVIATALSTERMIFLAAMVPVVGKRAADSVPPSALTARFASLTARLQAFDDGSTRWPSLTDAAETLYDELPRGVALVAASHLRRQYYGIWNEVCPVVSWPDVPSSYIVCRDDHVLNPTWAREVSRSRLGVQPVVLDGGHSPFLARPHQLADLLIKLSGATRGEAESELEEAAD